MLLPIKAYQDMKRHPIEQCIYITLADQLPLITQKYDRIYFGHEFCERKFPSSEHILRVWEKTNSQCKRLSIITPYVTDTGMERIARNLKPLQHWKDHIEIIFNDWGVYSFCKTELGFNNFCLGRLITRIRRDPRIPMVMNKIRPSVKQTFGNSSTFCTKYIEQLNELGVQRIELDNVWQSLVLPTALASVQLRYSLYYPYVFISTTRLCRSNGAATLDNYFPTKIHSCNKDCQNFSITLRDPKIGYEMYYQGNTYFGYNETLPKEDLLQEIDRLVYQPELPI
jgi:hypothetical protein